MIERKTVNRRIEEIRKSRGMTQPQFAEALGMEEKKGRSTINNWEQGAVQIKSDDLIKISRTFNTSVDYLLGLSDYQTVSEDMKITQKVTGLSEKAIKNVQKSDSLILSELLENGGFCALLVDIEDLINCEATLSTHLDSILDPPCRTKTMAISESQQMSEEEAEQMIYGNRSITVESLYNLVRLEKYELRDSFAEIMETIAPSVNLLSRAKLLLREYGCLNAFSGYQFEGGAGDGEY